MAAAIKASNTGFGFLCVQIAIETRLTLYITVAATRLWLEQDGQRHAMAYYHWTVSDFRRRFYKNYLDITED